MFYSFSGQRGDRVRAPATSGEVRCQFPNFRFFGNERKLQRAAPSGRQLRSPRLALASWHHELGLGATTRGQCDGRLAITTQPPSNN